MCRKLILHDLREDDAKQLPDTAQYTVFAATPAVHHCVGCFGCWIKTPAVCVIADRCRDFGAQMPLHDEILIVSRMVFGGLSPDVKAVLERSIGFMLPFLRNVNGEMHHTMRYEKLPDLHYIFYSPNMKERERETARKLAAANAVNFGAPRWSVSFRQSVQEIKEVL